jgi:hypothetical protein
MKRDGGRTIHHLHVSISYIGYDRRTWFEELLLDLRPLGGATTGTALGTGGGCRHREREEKRRERERVERKSIGKENKRRGRVSGGKERELGGGRHMTKGKGSGSTVD